MYVQKNVCGGKIAKLSLTMFILKSNHFRKASWSYWGAVAGERCKTVR